VDKCLDLQHQRQNLQQQWLASLFLITYILTSSVPNNLSKLIYRPEVREILAVIKSRK
jgi:hypothetical protein